MKLTNSQKETVISLFKTYTDNGKGVYLKAPTGSGKTFMASSFISEVMADAAIKEQKIMIVVATISNADLPGAFTRKLKEYKKYHVKFNSYNVEHIKSPSSSKSTKFEGDLEIKLEDKKVIVFGTSSFGSSMLFTQNKVLESFVNNIKTCDYKLIYIRDEAHIGCIKKKEAQRIDDVMKNNADFVLEMTATPKKGMKLIELTEEQMQNDGKFLLKNEPMVVKMDESATNEKVIDEAIAKFKKQKDIYNNLNMIEGDIINPAMLIQVINEPGIKNNPEGNKRYNEALNLLESRLMANDLKYLKYLGKKEVIGTNAPATLEYASGNDSTIDAIIFKVGPATGWDIPRANMLLQLRDVSSESLNIQTVGRIKRNPYPNLEYCQTTSKYWIYSSYQEKTRDLANYQLKDKFKELELMQGVIDMNHKLIKADEKEYKTKLKNWIDNRFKDYVFNSLDSNKKWPKKIVYRNLNFSLAKKQEIPNIIALKIENEVEWDKLISSNIFFNEIEFLELLGCIAKENNVHNEIIKYLFISLSSELEKIKNSTVKWHYNKDVYKIKQGKLLKNYYSIWINNNELKEDISNIYNYGYELISSKENIVQYFDSKPEQVFFNKLLDYIDDEFDNIDFIAKMPTLGSKIYYEYFNTENGKISKSYMDFAIFYNKKLIMFEIKGLESDYDPKKTSDLENAYMLYMQNKKDANIELIIYQYDKDTEKQQISCFDGNEWNKSNRPGKIFKKIFSKEKQWKNQI